jgi:Zn-dependent peptidase ImmA (M78 family)
MAHELGHIVLHHHLLALPVDVDVESEANRFAAEFLMPASDIRGYLTRPSLESLASHTPHWKVSMGALLERAASLGKIIERQRRHLWMMMSRYGYRTIEPVKSRSNSRRSLMSWSTFMCRNSGMKRGKSLNC